MKKKLAQEKPMRLIAKSNRLIEARHNLDIWELRIFTKMLMMVGAEVQGLDFIIPIREIIKDFDLPDSQQSYHYIREAADKLLGRKVYIYKQIEGERWERQATTLIKRYAVPVVKTEEGNFVEVNDKTNYVKIGFDEDVRDYILNYKDSFTRLNIGVLAELSPKSFRMYELLKQYEDTGFRTMTLDELRDIFDLTGQYNLYGSIKQRIIDKAQKDLEKYSDITFTYEEIKQGRAVYRLNFFIKPKHAKTKLLSNPLNISDEPPAPETSAFLQELLNTVGKEWGVTRTMLVQITEKFPEQHIRNAIEQTRKSAKAGKVRTSLAGFFVEVVRSGRNISEEKLSPEPSMVSKTRIKDNEARQVETERLVHEAQQKELLKKRFEKERLEILRLLADDVHLKQQVIDRIRLSIFRDLFDDTKSFEENLAKPSFFGAVSTVVRDILKK
jgi:plasmid replication initiation protein